MQNILIKTRLYKHACLGLSYLRATMMRSNNHGCIVFAILALFVVFVNCKSETRSTTATTALPGQDECTWGPTHWCSSVEVAGKCNVSRKITNFLLNFKVNTFIDLYSGKFAF